MVRHQDIAEAAGVSRTTVSKALNGLPGIDPGEAARIRALAEGMGYRRNRIAASVKTGRTNIMGCLVNNIANPYYSELMAGIEDVAADNDYVVVFLDWSRSHGRSIERLMEYKVDALLLTSPPDTAAIPLLQGLVDTGVKIVSGYDDPTVHGFSTVTCDYYPAAGTMVGHLASLGHRRIAMVSNNYPSSRVDGYCKAMAALGLTPMHLADDAYDDNLEGGLAAGLRIADMPNPPTAVMAYNDIMATGVVSSLESRGMVVPEAVSVTGFDGIASLSHGMRLTTMSTDNTGMGRCMAQEAIRLLNGLKPSHRVFPCTLFEGRTTRRLTTE